MWTDPIVQEVHAVRQQLMERAGGDIHQVIELAHSTHQPHRKMFQGQARRPLGWKPEFSGAITTTQYFGETSQDNAPKP